MSAVNARTFSAGFFYARKITQPYGCRSEHLFALARDSISVISNGTAAVFVCLANNTDAL
jgi:hypothetical protein